MEITDLSGTKIKVTDLKKAIKQANLFKSYAHENPSPAQILSDMKLQSYWSDFHDKLVELQSKLAEEK
ncbi:3-isopropylmalate dehydratase [Pedobacter sp. WC2423]|uniref:3-isopropylmalate dehydratase n=1 Tax=Pedobacter sp. WC2423 TaxID=3234142 RepID=UPI003466C303